MLWRWLQCYIFIVLNCCRAKFWHCDLCWILQVVILVEWDCFCLFFHFSSSVHCCIEDILGFRCVSGRHFKVSLVWLLHVYFWTASLYRNLPSPFPRVFCLYVLELVLIWFRIHDCAVKGFPYFVLKCRHADARLAAKVYYGSNRDWLKLVREGGNETCWLRRCFDASGVPHSELTMLTLTTNYYT